MEHDKHYGSLLTKEEIRHYSLNHKPPLVNPDSAIDFEIQLQPESFDLTVLDIHTFKTAGEIGFKKKKPSETEPMNINKLVEENGTYHLREGRYKVKYNEEIHFSNNIYGFVLPKSILTRSCCDLRSAH